MRFSSTGQWAARLLILCGLLFCTASAWSQDASTGDLLPVTEAYKFTANTDTPGVVKLHWSIAPNYYLYRGRMNFKGGDGVTLGEAQLPDGEKHDDQYLGPVETYHHSVDATIPYTVAPGTTRLKLSVRYQGCHETDPKICYPPHTEQIDVPLPAGVATTVAAAPTTSGLGNPLTAALNRNTSTDVVGMNGMALPAEQAFRFEAIAKDTQHLLLRWTMPKGYYLYRDQTTLSAPEESAIKLTPIWPEGTKHQDANFGNVTVYFGQLDLPVNIDGGMSGHKKLQLVANFQGCQEGGLCYPLMTRTVNVDLGSGVAAVGVTTATAPELPPADAGKASAEGGLVGALLLAFLGGIVLNLMPCVLPVLSIKAVSLLESGENKTRARRHALLYTAGVLCSFAVIGLSIVGLRATGHVLGWGSQLQQPLMVGVLACVMFAVGLSMSGVVQFGASLGNTGASLATRSGPAGDFFTGVLAVVVASPCTAPFMGSALAYAFAAPMLVALLVFLALGFGLALPFLAIGFVPALARLLPRPGRWMETLKEILAFPMYLTTVWLVWVLAHQRGADAVGLVLVTMVLLAMALWWFERSRQHSALSRGLALLLGIAALVPLYQLTKLAPPTQAVATEAGVVAYSPAKLAELRSAGTPVLVDMTADWCVTCKANEHTVLDTDAFRDLLKRTGAVYMKGDWTDVNPTISAFLQEYHSPGVPLYVVFPKNGGPGKALPTVLTSSLVEQALTDAAH